MDNGPHAAVSRQPPTTNPGRILVRGTNWLGDAVMTTPALLRLRERFPDARISLLTPEKLADLWKGHPAIDETISFRPGMGLTAVAARLRYQARNAGESSRSKMEPGRRPNETVMEAVRRQISGFIEMYALLLQMPFNRWRPGFDLALVLPNSPRSALEMLLAGIPRRIGYARRWRSSFLTQAVAPRPAAARMRKRSVAEIRQLAFGRAGRKHPAAAAPGSAAHQIHEYLRLVAVLGASPEPVPPQLFVSLPEIAAASKKFGLEAVSGPILGLNPGAEYGPAKRWPVERFIAAAQDIHQRIRGTWLLFGGKGDTEIVRPIAAALHASRIPQHDLSGRTTLRELMVLLKHCDVLLTNDTGPMHVAAALGTPVVVPFGSTSPELTGPGLPGDPRHQLLTANAPCSPCFLRECPIDFRCMTGLGPERVVEAVLKALRDENG